MHAVDKVFAQRDADTMHQKEAISEKKLRKGDGGWNQWKEILGWVLDSEHKMLELTEWHADCEAESKSVSRSGSEC